MKEAKLRKLGKRTSRNTLLNIAFNGFIKELKRRNIEDLDEIADLLDRVGIFNELPWFIKQWKEIIKREHEKTL